jgi:hypothetical protein
VCGDLSDGGRAGERRNSRNDRNIEVPQIYGSSTPVKEIGHGSTNGACTLLLQLRTTERVLERDDRTLQCRHWPEASTRLFGAS